MPNSPALPHLHQAGFPNALQIAVGHFQAGQLAQAESVCKAVLVNRSDDWQIWHLLGHIRLCLNDFEGAQRCFSEAARLNPVNPAVLADWGNALRKFRAHEKALTCYERALALHPDFLQAAYNKANTLRDLRRHQEAIHAYLRVIEIQPHMPQAYANLGNTYRDCGHLDLARIALEKALSLEPGLHAARYNLGLCELELLDFEKGWADFSARWQMPDFAHGQAAGHMRPWNPESTGQRLLIWAEQGLGDEIFWSGLLNEAHLLAPEVWVQADARLIPLLKRSFPRLQWVAGREHLSALTFDTQMPMGNLGAIFRRSLQDFESTVSPYLQVNLQESARIRHLIRPHDKRLCGVSWLSKNPRTGPDKSLSLEDLLPLLRQEDWLFVNLQYGNVSSEIDKLYEQHNINIIQYTAINNYHDIDGLASLIMACDAVVTTSNSTAHLAGAVGKKTCLILPEGSGKMWYWMQLKDNHSLWYPNIQLAATPEVSAHFLKF